MKVFGLVRLFKIGSRFPRSHFIADNIRKRYSIGILKNVRKFVRLDCQVRNYQLQIEFFNIVHNYKAISNFLRFRVTNETLKESVAYFRRQKLLLS